MYGSERLSVNPQYLLTLQNCKHIQILHRIEQRDHVMRSREEQSRCGKDEAMWRRVEERGWGRMMGMDRKDGFWSELEAKLEKGRKL